MTQTPPPVPSFSQPPLQPSPPPLPPDMPPLMTKAVASAFCGMLSMPTCLCWGVPSIVLGGIAIWLGVWVRKHYRGNTASEVANVLSWVGTIAGSIGILLGILGTIIWILTGAASVLGAFNGQY